MDRCRPGQSTQIVPFNHPGGWHTRKQGADWIGRNTYFGTRRFKQGTVKSSNSKRLVRHRLVAKAGKLCSLHEDFGCG